MKSSYLCEGHHYSFPGCDGSEGGREEGREGEKTGVNQLMCHSSNSSALFSLVHIEQVGSLGL